MDKIKTVKIKNPDGSVSEETYTISVDAKNVDMKNGKELQETIGTIDIDTDGNIAEQLENLNDNVDDLNMNIKKKAYFFNTVADMKAANLHEGDYVCTLGYYTANDGGNGTYRIISGTHTDDGGSYHQLNNNLFAELIIENNIINVKQFGAYGDNNHDDTEKIQLVINKFNNIYIPKGNYIISDTITVRENRDIYGEGPFITGIKYTGTDTAIAIKYIYFGRTKISNLSLSKNGGYSADDKTSKGIAFIYNTDNNRNVVNFFLENVDIRSFYINLRNGTANNLLNSVFEKCSFVYGHVNVANVGGYNNYFNNCNFSNAYSHAYEQQAGEMNFYGCSFENNHRGVVLKPSGGCYQFVNCFFEDTQKQGSLIEVVETGLTDISSINVDNCHFWGGTNQIYLRFTEHLTVKGCNMKNPSTRCIYYSGIDTHIKSVSLINNNFAIIPSLSPSFVDIVGYDTGWVDVDTSEATRGRFLDFQIRRIDKNIYWRGRLTNLTNATDRGQTFGITLPEEFRPSVKTDFILIASNNADSSYRTNFASLSIYPEGYFQYTGSLVSNSLNVIDLTAISYPR